MGARQLIDEVFNQHSPYLEPPGRSPEPSRSELHAEYLDDKVEEIWSQDWVRQGIEALIASRPEDIEAAIDDFIDDEIAENYKHDFDPPDPEDCRGMSSSEYRQYEQAWSDVRSELYPRILKRFADAGMAP